MCGGLFQAIFSNLRGNQPTSRANNAKASASGPLHPPECPLTAPWGLRISNTDLQKLVKGFEPRDMDDRWKIFASEQDLQGFIHIRIIRSWTGHEVYALKVASRFYQDGANEKRGSDAKISEITWDENVKGTAEEAKDSVAMLCKMLLHCELDYMD